MSIVTRSTQLQRMWKNAYDFGARPTTGSAAAYTYLTERVLSGRFSLVEVQAIAAGLQEGMAAKVR
jgi:hypothetical protein